MEIKMTNVIQLPTRKCAECGALGNKEFALVSETGHALSKFYCDKHLPSPMDEDQLRLLLDVRDGEIAALRTAAQAVVTEYPVAAGTTGVLSEEEPGYGSIKALRKTLEQTQPRLPRYDLNTMVEQITDENKHPPVGR